MAAAVQVGFDPSPSSISAAQRGEATQPPISSLPAAAPSTGIVPTRHRRQQQNAATLQQEEPFHPHHNGSVLTTAAGPMAEPFTSSSSSRSRRGVRFEPSIAREGGSTTAASLPSAAQPATSPLGGGRSKPAPLSPLLLSSVAAAAAASAANRRKRARDEGEHKEAKDKKAAQIGADSTGVKGGSEDDSDDDGPGIRRHAADVVSGMSSSRNRRGAAVESIIRVCRRVQTALASRKPKNHHNHNNDKHNHHSQQPPHHRDDRAELPTDLVRRRTGAFTMKKLCGVAMRAVPSSDLRPAISYGVTEGELIRHYWVHELKSFMYAMAREKFPQHVPKEDVAARVVAFLAEERQQKEKKNLTRDRENVARQKQQRIVDAKKLPVIKKNAKNSKSQAVVGKKGKKPHASVAAKKVAPVSTKKAVPSKAPSAAKKPVVPVKKQRKRL